MVDSLSEYIELLPVRFEHKQAFHRGKHRLASLIGVTVPEQWPQFPEAFDVSRGESRLSANWPSYFYLWPGGSALVGNGRFVGPPYAAGEVEIGYEIAPAFWNRGFAPSAVEAMLRIAFARKEARAVIAHTLADENASIAGLKKVGMSFVKAIPNTEVGFVWRWQIKRTK